MPKTSFESYKDKLAKRNPPLKRALAEERGYQAFVDNIRGDLKRLRESMKIGQSRIAEDMGVSQSVISRIETDDGDIGMLTIARYAAAIGLKPVINFVPTASSFANADGLERQMRAVDDLLAASVARLGAAQGRTGGASGVYVPAEMVAELGTMLVQQMTCSVAHAASALFSGASSAAPTGKGKEG